MRVSRIQAAENRETVINVASRLFREHGFDGIGLKDLMKGAGLTQGAFYKQFASKDDLAAQASRRAMERAFNRFSAAAAANPDNPLGAAIALYLSTEHRDERMEDRPVGVVADRGDRAADVDGREAVAEREVQAKRRLDPGSARQVGRGDRADREVVLGSRVGHARQRHGAGGEVDASRGRVRDRRGKGRRGGEETRKQED